MARGKTGALFAACFECGAAAAGAPPDLAAAARDHGEALGLLFQVQDDYLDLVGEKGRPLGSDLAEGKLSFPVVWALEHAPPAARARLEAIVRTPRSATTPDLVAEGLDLLTETGALAATAARLRAGAALLASSPPPPLAPLTPGLPERILAPVAHAL